MYPGARDVHYDGTSTARLTFAELADQAAQLAGALNDRGVHRDDVVAPLCWNVPAHLAA